LSLSLSPSFFLPLLSVRLLLTQSLVRGVKPGLEDLCGGGRTSDKRSTTSLLFLFLSLSLFPSLSVPPASLCPPRDTSLAAISRIDPTPGLRLRPFEREERERERER